MAASSSAPHLMHLSTISAPRTTTAMSSTHPPAMPQPQLQQQQHTVRVPSVPPGAGVGSSPPSDAASDATTAKLAAQKAKRKRSMIACKNCNERRVRCDGATTGYKTPPSKPSLPPARSRPTISSAGTQTTRAFVLTRPNRLPCSNCKHAGKTDCQFIESRRVRLVCPFVSCARRAGTNGSPAARTGGSKVATAHRAARGSHVRAPVRGGPAATASPEPTTQSGGDSSRTRPPRTDPPPQDPSRTLARAGT